MICLTQQFGDTAKLGPLNHIGDFVTKYVGTMVPFGSSAGVQNMSFGIVAVVLGQFLGGILLIASATLQMRGGGHSSSAAAPLLPTQAPWSQSSSGYRGW